MRTQTRQVVAVMLVAAASLTGCFASHERGGERARCGAVRCGSGEVCCSESCGICARAGDPCPPVVCLDAGPPGPRCGDAVCGPGELCCSGCPGEPDFCVADFDCPAVDCPPPPPGCEGCRADQLCCEGCFGATFCADGPGCPWTGCPVLPCDPASPCPAGMFCNPSDACGDAGVCTATPSGCTADCPGVCGCDGSTYCNECTARSAGVPVAHAGACGDAPCEGRSYCDCAADERCAPLIDTTRGCVCGCDDPFDCTGVDCACDCGGAEYRGCADAGRCPVTELRCDPGCTAFRIDSGCLACACPG